MIKLQARSIFSRIRKAQSVVMTTFGLAITSLASAAAAADTSDFCGLINAFKTFALQLAFYGTVAGLVVFGVMKVWSIISPQSGNEGRDYLKNLGIGILLIAGAGAIATAIFTAIAPEAMVCTIG